MQKATIQRNFLWRVAESFKNLPPYPVSNHKKEFFSAEENEMAGIAKAIAYPARIAILNMVAKNKTSDVATLVAAMPMTQASVSGHLAVMYESHLLNRTPEGNRTIYSMNWETLKKLDQNIHFLLSLGTA